MKYLAAIIAAALCLVIGLALRKPCEELTTPYAWRDLERVDSV